VYKNQPKPGAVKKPSRQKFYKSHRVLRKKPHFTLKSHNFTKNVFKKKRNPWKSPNYSEKVFNNNWNLFSSLAFLNRRLHFYRNVFKKPRYLYNILILSFSENIKSQFFWKYLLKASFSLQSLTFLNKSLYFFEDICKKPQIL
jgi:hypothetical protein